MLNSETEYIGPFYFESDGMIDRDIVRKEMDMVNRCTDAVFLLDEAGCPGTICELTMASMLGKNVYLFYLHRPDDQETESALHTPCWYPIVHSCIVNEYTRIYACSSKEDAAEQICALVRSWQE